MTNANDYSRIIGPEGDVPYPPTFTYTTLPPVETLASRCDAVLSLAEAAKALAEAAVTLIGCASQRRVAGWGVDRIADAAGAIASIAREQAEREVTE